MPSSIRVATDVAILVIYLIPTTSHEVTTIMIIMIICLATNTTVVVINCLVTNTTHEVINCLITNNNHGVIIAITILYTNLFSKRFYIGLTALAHTEISFVSIVEVGFLDILDVAELPMFDSSFYSFAFDLRLTVLLP